MGISDWSSDVCSSDLWVSRVHRALILARTRGDIDYAYTESVSHGSYERVLRQYAEKGVHLIVGEAFRAEAAARAVARDYPRIAFLMGSSGRPQPPNFSYIDKAQKSGLTGTGWSIS